MSSRKFLLCVYAREHDEIRKKKFSPVTKRALQLGNKQIKVMKSAWSTCVLYTLPYRNFPQHRLINQSDCGVSVYFLVLSPDQVQTYPRYQSCLAEAPLVMLTTRPQTLTALSVVLPLSFLKRQKTTEQGFNLSVARGQTLGSLSNEDGDGNENGIKPIGLDWQNNNFARASRFFVHFLAVVELTAT